MKYKTLCLGLLLVFGVFQVSAKTYHASSDEDTVKETSGYLGEMPTDDEDMENGSGSFSDESLDTSTKETTVYEETTVSPTTTEKVILPQDEVEESHEEEDVKQETISSTTEEAKLPSLLGRDRGRKVKTPDQANLDPKPLSPDAKPKAPMPEPEPSEPEPKPRNPDPKDDEPSRDIAESNASTQDTQLIAAIVVGGCIGLIVAICVIVVVAYRLKKKDEGSYALDEPKKPYPYTQGQEYLA